MYGLAVDTLGDVIAVDGAATPKVVENCEKLGCHNLIARTFVFSDTDMNLVSM